MLAESPVQDLPEKKMGKWAIFQVALLNIAVTIVILPLDSTLNRVMITELGISATLVSFLIALRFLTSPLRIWFGRLSDTRPIWGKYRTWYIATGMVLMTVGFLLTPAASTAIPKGGFSAILWAVFVFAILGFGVNMTTPIYFAIVTDQSSETQRSRIVALMFIMLGVVVVLAAVALSAAVGENPLENNRLFMIFGVIAIAVLALNVVGLTGVEQKNSKIKQSVDQEASSWSAIRNLLLSNREVMRFFIYLVLTFVAVEAQEIILEPFAASAFDMSVEETTRLTAIFRTGQLVMLAVGAWMVNRFGHRPSSYIGIATGIVGFAMIIVSGMQGQAIPFMAGVFVIGLCSGLIAVTNLTLMMNMTDGQSAGIYLGAWGFAQAVGVGAGTLLGGVIRDVSLFITGQDMISYYTVYSFEIILLIISVPFIMRLDLSKFKEIAHVQMTQVLATVGE